MMTGKKLFRDLEGHHQLEQCAHALLYIIFNVKKPEAWEAIKNEMSNMWRIYLSWSPGVRKDSESADN